MGRWGNMKRKPLVCGKKGKMKQEIEGADFFSMKLFFIQFKSTFFV